MDNLQMLADTYKIFKRQKYSIEGKHIATKLSKKQRETCQVFLPEDVQKITECTDFAHIHRMRNIFVSCRNMDSFAAARNLNETYKILPRKTQKYVLVLNFANPVEPGGGVRRGANAQEEDLCRKSSLLFSLESRTAKKYYRHNRSLRTNLGSDAIILTPEVEIIRDENGNLLQDSVVVSVMTCAAPMIRYGLEGLTQEQYLQLFYNRICGMLKCAAYWGYEYLVLGAFGCGAFGNDARVVAELFYRALKEFNYDGMRAEDFFARIDFAVLDRTPFRYNYQAFQEKMGDFYRDVKEQEIARVQQRIREREVYLDAIRGCMIGGAAGDALGYPVEFFQDSDIFERYGPEGITQYTLNRITGKASISDDTQMTLFTANGLLIGDTRGCLRGIQGPPHNYVALAYQDWLFTQSVDYGEEVPRQRFSWLLDVPELYDCRAPGNTCLSALEAACDEKPAGDYIAEPRNDSKGCGGVMRIAPLALNYQTSLEKLDMEAAQIAAITHGHALGYMPAAVLCHIINRIVFPGEQKMTLEEIIVEATATAEKIFAGNAYLQEMTDLLRKAVELSKNELDDLENIRQLGQGWVAEETLAISVYCSLKYADDFSKGIIAAVNHSGDSDSTGAVTGNILGALVGYAAIEDKWKQNLECADVILEIADDLCHGCQMSEYSFYEDSDWTRKYCHMQWKVETQKKLS